MRKAGAQHAGGDAVPVGQIAAETKMSLGENGAFEGEVGAHVRSGTVAGGGGAGEERERTAQVVGLFLSLQRQGRIVKHAQDGAIGDGTKSPLPVVIIGKGTDGAQLHDAKQSTQGDVDVKVCARKKSNFFAQCRQEGRSRDLEGIEAGQQASSGVISGAVGKDGEGVIGNAEDLYHCAHLGRSGDIANVSRDRSGPSRGPNRKRKSEHERRSYDGRSYDGPGSELTQAHSTPPPGGEIRR